MSTAFIANRHTVFTYLPCFSSLSCVFGPRVASVTRRISVPAIMLKISIVDTPAEQRIMLVGKLVGPWIWDLQKVWSRLIRNWVTADA